MTHRVFLCGQDYHKTDFKVEKRQIENHMWNIGPKRRSRGIWMDFWITFTSYYHTLLKVVKNVVLSVFLYYKHMRPQ